MGELQSLRKGKRTRTTDRTHRIRVYAYDAGVLVERRIVDRTYRSKRSVEPARDVVHVDAGGSDVCHLVYAGRGESIDGLSLDEIALSTIAPINVARGDENSGSARALRRRDNAGE